MDSQLPSDHEALTQATDAPAQRPSSKRLVLLMVVASAAAAIGFFTLSAKPKPRNSQLLTDTALQLYEHNPHGVCDAPEQHFDQLQMGCPSDRTDSCVAGNRDYAVFSDAWAACGRVPECGAIMKWTSGNYYLRRADDPKVDIPGAWSMYYTCHGQGIQAKSVYTPARYRHCQPPVGGFDLPPKGCKGSFPDGCVGGRNMNYHTFADAWEACGETPGCEVIMRWTTQGLYYLRRMDDPNLIKTGASSIRFSCYLEREGGIRDRYREGHYDEGHYHEGHAEGHYHEGHHGHHEGHHGYHDLDENHVGNDEHGNDGHWHR